MLSAAGAGGWLGWENRNTVIRIDIGHVAWTGHLYAVLVVGALLAAWFLLGAAFIQCRLAERRRARAAARARRRPAPYIAQQPAPRSGPQHRLRAHGAALPH